MLARIRVAGPTKRWWIWRNRWKWGPSSTLIARESTRRTTTSCQRRHRLVGCCGNRTEGMRIIIVIIITQVLRQSLEYPPPKTCHQQQQQQPRRQRPCATRRTRTRTSTVEIVTTPEVGALESGHLDVMLLQRSRRCFLVNSDRPDGRCRPR